MKYIYLTFVFTLSLLILWINIRLHSENYTREEKKEDIILQLNFLDSELVNNNLGDRMQALFPEGYVFINALYGLAWCELSLADPGDTLLEVRAIREAVYAYNSLDSEKARWSFPDNLNPEYGIFYNGWKNYLLSRVLTIDTVFEGSEKYIGKFRYQSEIISQALYKSGSPYLESYYGQSWPADMFVAMASLSNHDKIFKPKYKSQTDSWLKEVKGRLDTETNMIPHKVDSESGETVQGPRGCSMALCLRMLAEIDSEFARNQYLLFDSLFVDKIIGLPSVREYPRGKSGSGDIDSGPVIFGVGFSATIAMTGTYALYENHESAYHQYKTIHAFGFSKKSRDQKKYLLGQLPMADAFIAWGRATDLNYSDDMDKGGKKYWRITFHLLSLLVLIAMWAGYYGKEIKKAIRKGRRPE